MTTYTYEQCGTNLWEIWNTSTGRLYEILEATADEAAQYVRALNRAGALTEANASCRLMAYAFGA